MNGTFRVLFDDDGATIVQRLSETLFNSLWAMCVGHSVIGQFNSQVNAFVSRSYHCETVIRCESQIHRQRNFRETLRAKINSSCLSLSHLFEI